VSVTSPPSIIPPSMCAIAFDASRAEPISANANPVGLFSVRSNAISARTTTP
jgi:hypothetical protein